MEATPALGVAKSEMIQVLAFLGTTNFTLHTQFGNVVVWLARAASQHLMQDDAAICPDVACPDIPDPDSTVPERWVSPSLIERVKMEPAGLYSGPKARANEANQARNTSPREM